jgi:hypothetical protein
MLYKSCTTRLVIARLLESVGLAEAANANASKAQELLEGLKCHKDATWTHSSPRIDLDVKIRAVEQSQTSENDRRKQLLALADEARIRKDLTKECQLFIASVKAAKRWHEKDGNSESRLALHEAEQDFLS